MDTPKNETINCEIDKLNETYKKIADNLQEVYFIHIADGNKTKARIDIKKVKTRKDTFPQTQMYNLLERYFSEFGPGYYFMCDKDDESLGNILYCEVPIEGLYVTKDSYCLTYKEPERMCAECLYGDTGLYISDGFKDQLKRIIKDFEQEKGSN